MTTPSLSPQLECLARIAHEAGGVVLKHYTENIEARTKSDFSPVTAADEEAEAFITSRLARHFPGVPVLAEEASARGERPPLRETFFLVDPLDGTREFLKRNGEFTVNIALMAHGVPLAGAVYAPARKRLFLGEETSGAFEIPIAADQAFDLSDLTPIAARKPPPEGLTAALSRSHGDTQTEEFLRAYRIARTLISGSSLKFCLVAAGEADIYPRLGPTMEWDTAAGHAVLNAAGGSVTLLDGAPFLYGKAQEEFRNPPFLARGKL
jgi:3'(2'), 5'-bisphosphate nucleotidase